MRWPGNVPGDKQEVQLQGAGGDSQFFPAGEPQEGAGQQGGSRDAAWALAPASLPEGLLLVGCILCVVWGCLHDARCAGRQL